MKTMLLIVLFMLIVAGGITAQEVERVTVEITAADGQTLTGDYYAPIVETEGDPVPVLLFHQYNSNRYSWSMLIPNLQAAGYAVYTVDLRGHGDSGRQRDWIAAQTDTTLWIDWILEQPDTSDDSIILIGASIGSTMALLGCANHPACVTAVALSPGTNYFSLQTEPALAALQDRSALLVAMQRDRESAEAVRVLTAAAPGEVGAQIYNGSTHGTAMFGNFADGQLQALIVDWLRWHNTRNES